MRNLKRTISLLVSFIMVAAFCLVPTVAHTSDAGELPCINVEFTAAWKTQNSSLDGYAGAGVDQGDPTASTSSLCLDIANEKLIPGDFPIAGWAIADKWKAGAPTAKDLAKLFNKGGTLKLTDKMSAKPKDGPSAGKKDSATSSSLAGDWEASGKVITFEAISARPKDTKLVVNYSFYADNDGDSNGLWCLAEKTGTKAIDEDGDKADNLLITKPADKKPDASSVWEPYGDIAVVEVTGAASVTSLVKDLGSDGKVVKDVYFVKTAAVKDTSGTNNKYTAATKGYKITVSSLGKHKVIKPDYKKGVIKAKAGMALSIEDAAGSGNNGDFINYGKSAVAAKPGFPAVYAVPKDGVAFVADPAGAGTATSFTLATAKKPASTKFYMKIAQAGVITPTSGDFKAGEFAVDAATGKVTYDKKLLEFTTTDPAGSATPKWGGFPKITANTSNVWVRLKTTAKQDKADGNKSSPMDGTKSASEPYRLTITFGKLGETPMKDGVIDTALDAKRKSGVKLVEFFA